MQVRYLERKLKAVEKLLRQDDTLAAADVEIEQTTRHHRQGEIFRAEINLRAAQGSFRAEAHGESVIAAIDAMKDEITRQLAQKKDKSIALRKKGAHQMKEVLRDAAL
ncbi:MAG: HPF/RaiA family ribosome-associated protein [Patescibacteria group bacterium]|nr:HPF/RaiA family ribosome-associated protein [Patescibacteria group bacterium]